MQAFGSILAIAGAAAFPYLHSRKVEKDKQDNFLEILSELADEASEELWLLINCFYRPDKEVFLMRQYLGNGRAHNWPGLLEAVEQVRIIDLQPNKARDVGKIRNAVSYGAFVAEELSKWMTEGQSHPEVVEALRAKRDLLDFLRNFLPASKRDPKDCWAREVGRISEVEKRSTLEPFNYAGVKVYRRFAWASQEAYAPDKVFVQLVFPYGEQFPPLIEVPNSDGWKSVKQADMAARHHAAVVIEGMKMNY
ncbi:hypothetical protein D3C78_702780 [compost metagenome]